MNRDLCGKEWALQPALPILMMALLAGCASSPKDRSGPAPKWEQDKAPTEIPDDLAAIPDPVPRPEPRSRYGNPASYEVHGKRYYVMDSATGYKERGHASWYGTKFHGRRTSSGEPYDMFQMTAAHKSLPLPTYVRVTHLGNGRSIIVRVNDRGPFHPGRIIDLSYAAATKLDIVRTGFAEVEVEAINPARPATTPRPPLPHSPDQPSYLEAGVFNDPVTAIALREELTSLGLLDIEIRQDADGQWHRVLVGPYADPERLAAAEARLQSAYFPARRVTQ